MRLNFSRLGYVLCIGLLLATLGGCVSGTSGTAALTADRVKEIKKGVTTRRDIEAMFGPPEMVTMMGGGKHILSYSFSQTNVHPSPMAYVPVVNMFQSQAEGQTQVRTLQVNLDANDVVEDFQFNDNTNNVESTVGIFGTSTKSTPVASPKQATP